MDNQCILCGSTSNTHYVTVGRVSYSKCNDCGLIFQNPRVKDVIAENIIASDSCSRHFEIKENRATRKPYYLKYIRLIEKYLPPALQTKEKSILEIGCGAGGFLSAAKDAGWKVTGIEISETLAKIANEKFGLNVLLGEINSLNLKPESFDAAALNMVIEHLEFPLKTLETIHNLLRSNGVLLIHTPNYDNTTIKKSKNEKYYPPSHTFLFTPHTLKKSLEKAGYSVKATVTTGFKFPKSNIIIKPIEKIFELSYWLQKKAMRLRIIAQKI
ncbi:MAG: class I SAM-dependent methyltransferase [Planctomycetota bacterium]